MPTAQLCASPQAPEPDNNNRGRSLYKIQNHKVSENPLHQTHLDRDGYERMYRQSIEQPDMFWA